uniref:Uncharacterized protein n=1 Tax=Arundo donax TaxID=35708 RepID=A0A0A9B7P3_ARUDO
MVCYIFCWFIHAYFTYVGSYLCIIIYCKFEIALSSFVYA